MKKRGIQQQDQTRAFGVLVLISQAALCFIYGFYSQYQSSAQMNDNDNILITGLILLCLVGFTLLFSYIKSTTMLTFIHVLFMFAFSLQMFFMFRGMWELVDIPSNSQRTQFGEKLLKISLTNNNQDRQQSRLIKQASFADFLPCFLSLIIGYGAMIGRVGHLEVFFYTIFGTGLYELNSQLFWKYFITDCGFGMRTFLMGGVTGFFTGIFLWSRKSTKDHPRYSSDKIHQKLSLIGYIFVWSFFPFLALSDLYHKTSKGTDNYILHAATLNIWLALVSSTIGSCIACLFMYKKLSIREIAFAGLSGGIAYSSSSDLIFNPGFALTIGSLTGFFTAIFHRFLIKKVNKKGVLDSIGILTAYLIPGLVAGILSSIVRAVGSQKNGGYQANINEKITKNQEGLYQLAGIGLTLALGFGTSLVMAFFYIFFNYRDRYEQFTSYLHIEMKEKVKEKSSEKED